MADIWMPTEIHVRKISDLVPYENNARIHSPEQIEKLRRSILQFGFLRPLLINSENGVLCGHGRMEAAKLAGMTELPCVLADHLSEEERIAYILADNELAEQASWDRDIVSAELIRLRDAGFDISLTGFCEDDIRLDIPAEPFEDEDFDPEPQEDEHVEPGTIWRLGQHRLMCGDSTSEADVQRLMGGELAELLLTDPPYGVAYESKTTGLKIENDDLHDTGLHDFLVAAFNNARNSLRPSAPYYIWYPDGEPALEFRLALRDAAMPVHQSLVWVKNQFTLGRQDHQWKHEPCLYGLQHEKCEYGWQRDHAHVWHGTRKQSTVMEFDKPKRSEEHPTMKPVKLFAYQIGNSTIQGDRVLDLFAGSGTTVIACEQLNRKAYCMEKDGRYAAVIIRRWETMTGQKAEQINE